ncbi:hypothetical protein [Haloarcula marina]|uniref:hypothetical protein n=1 Tax=Haloarcula marina TaxID=2961574 RepID=UPI0020B848AA|nr:hypothetical protein [Halomicroarcula marina]
MGAFTTALFYLTPLPTVSVLRAVGIFSSVILSFALLVVYIQMASEQSTQTQAVAKQAKLQEQVIAIQERQSDILDNQTELMRSERAPLITIEDYFAIENRLFVVLSNYGDALAKNPKLEVIVRGVVESENTGSGKGKYVTEVLKNGSDGFLMPLTRPDRISTGDEVLQAKELNQTFAGPVYIDIASDEMTLDKFPYSVDDWIAEGYSALVMQVIVYTEYTYPISGHVKRAIKPQYIELEYGMSFEEAIEHGINAYGPGIWNDETEFVMMDGQKQHTVDRE